MEINYDALREKKSSLMRPHGVTATARGIAGEFVGWPKQLG